MRTISRRTRYALRALYVLVETGGGQPLIAATLAQRSNVPGAFLEGILVSLTRVGILTSRKGRQRGYALARAAADISVGQVITAIDGPIDPLPCLNETFPRRCDECVGPVSSCQTRALVAQVRAAASAVLDGTSLADAAAAASRP